LHAHETQRLRKVSGRFSTQNDIKTSYCVYLFISGGSGESPPPHTRHPQGAAVQENCLSVNVWPGDLWRLVAQYITAFDYISDLVIKFVCKTLLLSSDPAGTYDYEVTTTAHFFPGRDRARSPTQAGLRKIGSKSLSQYVCPTSAPATRGARHNVITSFKMGRLK